MFWILFVFLLAGCSLAGSGSTAIERSSLDIPQGLIDAGTPSSTPGVTSVAVTSTPVSPAITPSSTSPSSQKLVETALTPLPVSATVVICSPLSIHPLEELPQIISDPYHPPPPGKEQRHHGVDFSYYRRGDRLTIQGVGVQAALAGVVSTALAETFPYGNVVIIETEYAALPDRWVEALQIPAGYSIYTLYAHMDQPPKVAQGENVSSCQPLGDVGLSGNAAEPHLHLEMRLGEPGSRVSSMGFYKADDTEEERSNYVRWRTSGDFQHFDPMLLLSGLSEEAGSDQ